MYCFGSERDELIVDTLAQVMVAQAPCNAPKSWRGTAHVQNHIDALAASGRQWRGAVGDWSREESIEFLQPELQSRKHFYEARRSRMVRGRHELPESLHETTRDVCSGDVVKRVHATRELSTVAIKKTLLSVTAVNEKLKKWKDGEAGLAWKATRDKMFQADDPDFSSDD